MSASRQTAIIAAMVLTLAAAAGGAAAASAPPDLLRRMETSLREWDLAAATAAATEALAAAPDDPSALFLAARVAFHESDYPRALDLARRAAAAAGEDESARQPKEFAAWLADRQSTWGAFTEQRRGPFVIRTTARDAILVPYAFDALEGAARAMKEEFGFEPSRPVVVEFYPTRRSFIAASTLTREEVETSGTLAICHFNRIMMLSPAVLSRGYDWMDALCHEFVHYAIYSIGGSAVPVWLHEGIAKHLETRWRAGTPEPLDPRMASILAEGLETGQWVTFQQMHPSMAKLPSAGLVALAFAEVAVTIDMLRSTRGADAAGRLVREVRARSGDVDAALRGLWGIGLADLESEAKAHAGARGFARVPGLSVLARSAATDAQPWLRFADEGAEPDDPEAEARGIEDRRAQDWVLLGDRLKGRRYFDAAIIEYDKALERLGQSEPLVVNRKALALLQLGRVDEATAVLRECLAFTPGMAATLDNLAESEMRLAAAAKDEATADTHRRRALGYARQSEMINPFNLDTHARLASLLERLGQVEEAARSRERIALLRRPS